MRYLNWTRKGSLNCLAVMSLVALPYLCIRFVFHIFREDMLHIFQEDLKRFVKQPNSSDVDSRVILIWTSYFGGVFPHIAKGLGRCSNQRCQITHDRRNLSRASAVIFHARDLNAQDLPPNRSSNQSFVFYNLEAPPYDGISGDARWRYFFNVTWTYRLDSDVRDLYYFQGWSETKWDKDKTTLEFLRNKNKRAVAFISHCNSNGNRDGLIKELKKYFPVDIYGNCGKAGCPRSSPECEPELIGKYSFYLAFENSHCRDYLTEKAIRGYNYGAVPVVYGGGNYSHFFPKHSYIDVSDFANAEHLGTYLHNLTLSQESYERFHKWHFNEISNRPPTWTEDSWGLCRLCELLHDANFKQTSRVADLHEWWVVMGNCTSYRNSGSSPKV